MKKKDRDPLPVTWENVNMESLARSVVAYARIGLDPAQKNHINMIPYKNNTTGKYDIGFIEGYRGIELKAMKYGLDVPDAVIVELVYTNDKFKPIKKSLNNPYESYEFEIVDAFDRGEIKGGFYYHIYSKYPEKNKLVIMTLKDIEKRKPKYASSEFWGGEKDVWKDGKKVGTEQVEGWFEKMCYKTIYRALTTISQLTARK
jgi:recombination protein RecT